jgi:hypothetical protein
MKGIDSYQIGEHGTAQEDHVSPSGGILNAHFEFTESLGVSLEYPRNPQFLELLIQP